MAETGIDYKVVFKVLPEAAVSLTPDLVIVDVNENFLELTGRNLEELVGQDALEAFPDPLRPVGAVPLRPLRASVDDVLASGERDIIKLRRLDLEDPGRPGVFEEQLWRVINSPLHDDDGQVTMVEVIAEDVTPVIVQYRAMQAQFG